MVDTNKILLKQCKYICILLCTQLTVYGSELLQVHIGAAQAVSSQNRYSCQQDFVYHNQQPSFLKWLKGNNTQSTNDGYIAGLFHGFSRERDDKDRFEEIKKKNGLLIAETVHQLFVDHFKSNLGRVNSDIEDDEMKNLLYRAFRNVNLGLKEKFSSLMYNNGATATIVYRVGNRLFICNAGHNRVVSGSTCNDQTLDHTANNPEEKRRFSKDSISLSYGGCMRLSGELLTTRFFGYTNILQYIEPACFTNPVPDIVVIDLTKNPIIIMGTHALWGGISEKGSEEAFQKNDNRFAYKLIEQTLKNNSIDKACLALIAAAICYRHNTSKTSKKCMKLIKALAHKNTESSLKKEQKISKEELKEKIKYVLQNTDKNAIKSFIDENGGILGDNATAIVMHATYKPLSTTKKSSKPIITPRLMFRNALLLCFVFCVYLMDKNLSNEAAPFIIFLILYAGIKLDSFLFKNC